ncbi:ran-specific GTPase-activating protein-like isoform X1 [Ciona intestinalis]
MAENVEAKEPAVAVQQPEPIVKLPASVMPKLEEDEDVLFKMRAKLFRWAKEADPPEWKERGTGDIKILKHKETARIRLLMRRDKTFKICANHYITLSMKLVSHCESERAWMWMATADFADEEAKEELFAIRFLNAENANKFKDKFCECQEMLKAAGMQVWLNLAKMMSPDEVSSAEDSEDEKDAGKEKETKESEELTDKLDDLSVKDEKNKEVTKSEEAGEKFVEKISQKDSTVEDSPEK